MRILLALLFLLNFSFNQKKIFSHNEIKFSTQKITALVSFDKYKNNQLLESKQYINKKIIIIIISIFIIGIIIFYFLFQNNKLNKKNKLIDIQSKIQDEIINATIDGREKERKKIAAFLHDDISALLSSAGMHLKVITLKNNNPSEELLKTKAILEEVHDKIRHLSHELLPTLSLRFGLPYAIKNLCEKNSNSSIYFEYINSIPQNARYNEGFETKIYFILSELLNNIIKHSNANEAKISTTLKNNNLLIKISDNGHGFDTQILNEIESYGLNQIQSRIRNLKGKFKIKSKMNHGTSIEIKIPILD